MKANDEIYKGSADMCKIDKEIIIVIKELFAKFWS